jgi:hypothetical protein
MISVDTDTGSYKHFEHQMVAGELIFGFRENAFMKHSNGTLGGSDFYQGRVAVLIREIRNPVWRWGRIPHRSPASCRRRRNGNSRI